MPAGLTVLGSELVALPGQNMALALLEVAVGAGTDPAVLPVVVAELGTAVVATVGSGSPVLADLAVLPVADLGSHPVLLGQLGQGALGRRPAVLGSHLDHHQGS